MLVSILRFIRGTVRFTAEGKYPERFLNITAKSRIRLFDVKRRDSGYEACMYRSDYRGIRRYARGAGVRLRIREKKGLPAALFRYRDRVGVLFGACAFILTVFVMSLFIWSVDITGLETVSRSEMQDVLREHGLYVGAFKPALDYRRIAREVMLERHEIGWMAVNVTDSYACVEVKEEAPAPEVADISAPCNIKAGCDGQIIRIDAGEGERMVTEGSGVIEGQLIVSGVMKDEQGVCRLVHADARVFARTERQASFSVPQRFVTLNPDAQTATRSAVELFGLRLPYRFGAVDSPYAFVNRTVASPAPLGVTLPVGVAQETAYAMTYEELALDDNSAQEILSREAQLYEAFCLPDCEIEARREQLSAENGVYTLSVTYTCVEDIADEEPIGVDENTDFNG